MDSKFFVENLISSGFGPFMGVPCSVFKPLLNYISDNQKNIQNYICSSEGESLGLAAGFSFSSKTPVVYMQNDGYGNAINPLSSLQLMNKLPTLLLISWRGEPDKKDAPQHAIMGDTIMELLSVFKIPHIVLDEDNLNDSIKCAKEYISKELKPFAFIVKKGFLSSYEKKDVNKVIDNDISNLFIRMDYLKVLQKNLDPSDILLGTTGFSGREVYEYIDHKGKFYMMGSMGCVPSIGLGLAIENRNKRVLVIDGDGALLMKLGTLSTIGYYAPKNLIHFCFDNSSYESTGNTPTTAKTTNFCAVAEACGYKDTFEISTVSEFEGFLKNRINCLNGPSFIHIKIKSGSMNSLGRPTSSPIEMKDKFMEFLDE